MSATLRSGTSASSWEIVVMPAAKACLGERNLHWRPLTITDPLSAACTPEMILPTVDLPAPFSPTRPWMLPRRMEMSAQSTAWVEPNRFDTARSSI